MFRRASRYGEAVVRGRRRRSSATSRLSEEEQVRAGGTATAAAAAAARVVAAGLSLRAARRDVLARSSGVDAREVDVRVDAADDRAQRDEDKQNDEPDEHDG